MIFQTFSIFIGIYRARDTDQGTCTSTVCKATNTIEATVHIMILIFFNGDPIYAVWRFDGLD